MPLLHYALFAVATVIALVFAWLPVEISLGAFLYEDTFYYLKLAEHAASGQGVSFDGVSPTNGFHPAWLLLCTGLALVFGGDLLVHAVLTLAALLHVAQGSVIYSALRERPAFALVVAGFWLLNYRVLASNLCGLETPLATLAALLVLRELMAWTRRGALGSGVALGALLGAAVLCRFDLALLGLVAIGWLLLHPGLQSASRPRVLCALRAAGSAAMMLVLWFAWSRAQSGVWLPNSRAAIALVEAAHAGTGDLLGGFSERVLSGIWWATHSANLVGVWPIPMPRPGVDAAGYWLGVALLLSLLPAALGWGLVIARRTVPARLAWPLCGYALLHVGWYVLFSRAEIRYLMPALAALFVAAGLVAGEVWESKPSALVRRAGVAAVVLLFANVCVAGVLAWRVGYGTTFTHRYHPLLLEAARAIDASTAPGTVVGAWNAGVVGYFSKRTVVNLDGVVNDDALAAMKEKRLLAYIRSRGIERIVDMPEQFERFLEPFGGERDWRAAFIEGGQMFSDADGRRVVVRRLRSGAGGSGD